MKIKSNEISHVLTSNFENVYSEFHFRLFTKLICKFSFYFSALSIFQNNDSFLLANQDIPGNLLWEDLYMASPNSKVILTVRDSEHAWWNSWIGFTKQESEKTGNPGHLLVKGVP